MTHRHAFTVSLAVLIVALLAGGCGGDDGGGGVLSSSSTATPGSTTTSAVTTRPGERVDAPQPTTTPNVAQPPDSLLDGQHVAFMVDVDTGSRTVDVDVVQWFLRPDFEAAIAEGRLSAEDPCIELDYCIANAQDRVRTLPVDPDARVSVVDYDDCCESVRAESLDDVFTRMREGRDLFVLTVAGGRITAIDELYLA